MALLKEDNNFTHVIAIDFGTGASGYPSIDAASQSPLGFPIKKASWGSRCLTLVMAVTIRRLPPLSFSTKTKSSYSSELMPFKNMHKSLRMEALPISSRTYTFNDSVQNALIAYAHSCQSCRRTLNASTNHRRTHSQIHQPASTE